MTDVISVSDAARPFSTMCLAVQRGSIDDPPGKPGVAWLTAQMLMRGADGMSRQAIADSLEGLGSVVELSVGRDQTMLWADALTRKRPELIDYLERIVARPSFDAGELEQLKRETIAELHAMRDDDSVLGLRFFVRALYGDHPYGRPLKGSEASLPSVTRADLEAFHRGWSRAGTLLGLAGDIGALDMGSLAARLTAGIAGEAAARVVPGFSRKASDGKWQVVIVDKPERTQTQVYMGHIALAGTGPGARGVHHPAWTALQVGQTTFGGTFTSRLSHEMREKRGWSYGAWSQIAGDERLATFLLRFYPAAKDLLPALQLSDELLSEFVRTGPSDAELDAAQSYLQNGFVFAVDTAARRLSELVSARLIGHPDGWVDATVERLQKVAHADAVRAVREHLVPDDMIVAVVGTARELEPQLAGWSRVRSVEVVDWKTPI